MTELKDGMILYHGSYTKVPNIDISKCGEYRVWNKMINCENTAP